MHQFLQLYKDSFGGLSKEVWLLAFVSFINRSGTMVITFLTVYLTIQLGYSILEAGLVMTFFGAGSVLGTFIGGWLTDRYGYYQVMFWSLLVGGFSFFILIPLTELWEFCIGVFIVSMIADSFRPANLAAIGIYSSEENQTRSLSLLRLAFNLGLSFGPAVGGFIAMTWSYSALFIIDGMTCIFAAFAFIALLPKRKSEREELAKGNPNVEPEATLSAYKDIFYLKFIFVTLLNLIVFMHLFTILPHYYKVHFGFTEFQIGLLLGLNGLVIAITEMPIIYKLENQNKTFSIILVGTFLIGFAYWIFPLWGFWAGTAVISMLAITVGEIVNFPFLNSVALERAPAVRRGEYMGLYGMSFSVALIIAPTLGGWIAETWNYNTLWWVLGGINILAMLGYYYLKGEYQIEQEEKAKEKELELV